MLKKDLLIKLQEVADDADINETILSIDDFAKSSELNVSKITLDDYKNILENNDLIKGYYARTFDSAVGKAVEKHDKKIREEEVPKLVQEGIKAKSLEGLTEDQIKYKNLESEFEKMKAENAREKLSSKYSKVLGEKQLPIELVDYILSDDEEKINNNIEFFSNLITNSVNNGVKERLGNKDETPPKDEQLNEEEQLNKQLEQAMGIR